MRPTDPGTAALLPLPRAFHRVLVIAAHPDDAEFAFGATVARLTDEGAQVVYVVVSDGAQGGEDPDEPTAELVATRYAEQREAAGTLGVSEVVFLGLPDGTLADTPALRLALTREIRRHRPELVLTHQPLRSLQFPVGASHPDHLAVGEAALNAVYPFARNPRAFPELLAEGLPAHRVAEVWVPGHEHADLFVDVSRSAERKVAAVLTHRSQFRTSKDPRADVQWVTDRMRGNGASAGCAHADAFKRIVTDAAGAAGPPPARQRTDTPGDGAP
ncbi:MULTISPECIES: PIG-L deacetylase family protein [unclassified Streptomyces]|uniref:PIG-L deacetylase family protein n=1 Tax=unclassified Streptomyces TaxID=2593676 RepID=UPI002552464C|nr:MULTISPECIES: PIG-L deacetylase family protein [unclassified Streptomyces]WRZ68294.1 PIG-L family deacetylase [Streptomyces sp. NBC_01257]WSU62243.1 PIG-L family deacetylase [Streptomyces sp. NBC_01104]